MGEKERIPCFFSHAVLCGITPLLVGCMLGGSGAEISVHEHLMTIS
jgi:hypothetical protein